MPIKKELCKNYQRGSCQYGQRCKFLHVTQQQPKSNIFGGGAQSGSYGQQQKSNPYGFGVQNSSQSKGSTDYGSKPNNQFKPFENKWTRFSPIPNTGAPSARQSENQTQATNHKCTDPESCRRIVVEDFENERPLWKLTCYGHLKNAPCDIIGDISYEELRAAAYDDAKRGLSLQSIVERERNLLSSKLVEFENLCKPHAVAPSSTLPNQKPFSGTSSNAFSSFGQLGSSLNMGPPAPLNNGFGQLNSSAPSRQISSAFGTKNMPSENAGEILRFCLCGAFSLFLLTVILVGLFGSQFPASSTITGFSSNGALRESNPFSPSPSSAQFLRTTNNQSPILSMGLDYTSNANAPAQVAMGVQLATNMQKEDISGDVSIWSKNKWNPGEVPEEAPPDAFVDAV
ncbi:zinc finger CCCH domain-containing protein 16 isoform X2 [Ziziphus jujuba]|uniref:Zinc finger CCCH domain-containing protein 16 isoform X2 n=1 Tax=Ziziphus jujuba TaxID=326968 RepID=A0ABM4A1H2_ZIZJJ|nr:zinc finger CCCH domain-containing protein 16 isoform X2 [Ziziphus jujuba]